MATTQQLTVDANTVALWHMDGTVGTAAKKDNAEGTAARDLTEVSAPSSATGFDGTTDGAYDLDEADQDEEVYTADFLGAVTALTVEGWVYFDVLDATLDMICTQWGLNVTADQAWYMAAQNGKFRFSVTSDGTTEIYTDSNSSVFSTGQWYYIAAVYDGSAQTVTLYINGDPVAATSSATIPTALHNSSQAIRFGKWIEINQSEYKLNGKVDEFRISTVARSATEIYNYYNDVGGFTPRAMLF